MKTVVVSQRIDKYPGRDEVRDALDQRLCLWLSEAGYISVPMPNLLHAGKNDSQNGLEEWLLAIQPNAILLSGGNDIGDEKIRDANEYYLLGYAKKHQLPVLGICRGMQMIGLWAGVELKKVSGHIKSHHSLTGLISHTVNSFHNYSLLQCPNNFSILAHSEDGEIEAICHNFLPWEGWMWHPEREANFNSSDMKRLKGLFGD
jgi:gamma-glutamyl-gamma-aminobutyrate hydrolase PuuD